jgi:hypothetical protein
MTDKHSRALTCATALIPCDSETAGKGEAASNGDLYLSDWRFDIFSPDGAHVLLLQNHHGPYHIVSTDRLKAYLNHKREPDYILGNKGAPNAALVHNDGHWVSADEVEYTVSCCDTSERLP